MSECTHFVVLRNLNSIPMKNFNLSLRKTYLFALMGTLILTSCSTDDTPSEDVSAIRQAEAANLNANAQVAAAQAALLNAQVEVQVAQAEQIKLQNALIAIQNATAQAESDLTIAEIQAQMLAAEAARVDAQLALNIAMNTLDASMAEMQADEVREIMSKLSLEQGKLSDLMSDRNTLVKDLNIANFNLEFGVDYSNEMSLITLQSTLESDNQFLGELESQLTLLEEDIDGAQDVAERLSTLNSERIINQNKIDSLTTVDREYNSELSPLYSQRGDLFDLKFAYENAVIIATNYEANLESNQANLALWNEQLVFIENQLSLSSAALVEAEGRLDAANVEYSTRVEATAVAEAVIPGLENAVEDAELAYNMAVAARNEYTGTDSTVISELDLAITDADTALTDAQTALSDANALLNDAQILENDYFNSVVAPEESTVVNLNIQIDNLQNDIMNITRSIKDNEIWMIEQADNVSEAQIYISENKEAYDQISADYEILLAEIQELEMKISEVNDLRNNLWMLNNNIQSLIVYYDNITDNNTWYTNQVNSLEDQIAYVELGIKTTETDIKRVENNMIIVAEDLQQEVDRLTDEIAVIDVQIEGQTGIVTHYEDLLSQALAE